MKMNDMRLNELFYLLYNLQGVGWANFLATAETNAFQSGTGKSD